MPQSAGGVGHTLHVVDEIRAGATESSSEVYKEALLAMYDRQILLTRTAWAWYVLPCITGLVVASLATITRRCLVL
jgi:hypothetical protein